MGDLKTGFSDEAILYEMYLSKEPAEVFERIAEQGLFEQLSLHSHTSQYGQLRVLFADDGSWLYERFARVLHDILKHLTSLVSSHILEACRTNVCFLLRKQQPS